MYGMANLSTNEPLTRSYYGCGLCQVSLQAGKVDIDSWLSAAVCRLVTRLFAAIVGTTAGR